MATPTTYYNLLKPATGETYDVNLLDTNYDKIDAELHNASLRALGYVAYAEMAANSSALTTIAVATFIASFTFKAGRRYRIGASGGGFFSDTASTFAFAINTCSTADGSSVTTGLTQIKARSVRGDVASEGRELMSIAKENFTVASDTTLQLKLTAARLNGTGTVTLASDSTNRVCLFVEDLGAQF